MNNENLVRFAKCLSGIYSNKQQAIKNPRYFAHINIYFIPLPWELLNGPSFYSEQSHDYSPWKPYRQNISHLIKKDNVLILSLYRLINANRIAGGGHHPELLSNIDKDNLIRRRGCDMHFQEINSCHFLGKVEAGCKCLIEKQGFQTYLDSTVELKADQLISLDRGIDISTGKKVWGSENGPLVFTKTLDLSEKLKMKWKI